MVPITTGCGGADCEGRILRERRMELGMTQEEVAAKLYVSRQAVSSWEKGMTMPSIDSFILLMELFDTDLEELLCLRRKQNEI